jgi:biopolymer transport protein ExbD
MPLRVPPEEESGMNLTPMIDVVMLLNIFFMVGSRLVEPEKQYEINLPHRDRRPSADRSSRRDHRQCQR